jgi:ribonuclease PH|tara:strand:- start:4565 stop:4777 length:213 start_codon:yes stop_codon:yes gene_type:complete
MIITIKNDDKEVVYDVSKIKDADTKQEATIIINKVGQLQTTIEALDFASRTHRANLEELLKKTKEAVVED